MLSRLTIAGLLVSSSLALRAGEVLDAVVGTVNGHVVLQSDWDDEVRYECFMSGHALQSVMPQDRKASLDRLIDQELLREQMSSADFKFADAGEIEKQVEGLKQDYSRGHNGQTWSAALSDYHITDKELKAHVALELNQLRLVDARLRPAIQVDTVAVETYYRQEVLPKLAGAGGPPLTLAQAAPEIRELLLQQKMNELLASWLETLRGQAQIHLFVPIPTAPPVQGQ